MTLWIQIKRFQDQVYLWQSNRFNELVGTLPDKHNQSASLNIFLGRHHKNTALSIFSGNFRRRGSQPNSINLELDHNTQYTQSPLFIADCDVEISDNGSVQSTRPEGCSVPWAGHGGPAVLPTVLTRCLFNFTDSVWLFADDYGGDAGIRKVVSYINSVQTRAIHPCGIKPRLIVVRSKKTNIDLDAIESFELFSQVETLNLPVHSSQLRSETLRQRLLQVVESCRQKRSTSHLLFSSPHLCRFVQDNISHVARDLDQTFDCISSARNDFTSAPFACHLENFLRVAQDARPPFEVILKFIASSLVMDAYPPSMAGFGPRMLFKTLYQSECLQACRAVYGDADATTLVVSGLEKHFAAYSDIVLSGQTALAVRSDVISVTGKYWASFNSNQTCFSCMRRIPENSLQCGHLICDVCVEIFGQGIVGSETDLAVKICCICGSKVDQVVALMPRTAAPRLLSIDGGGSRGVIPLESLQLLQESIGSDYPLQDLFDFAIGTSAGGLTILGLFCRGLSIDQSKQTFRTLATKIFKGSNSHERSFLGHCRHALKSAVNDYVYDVREMETALIDLFGGDTRMLGYNPFSRSTTKIAVTAASDEAPTARLFANYNGSNPCGVDCEHPQEPSHEPRIWEAARATSAVPVLFPSIRIPHVGTFWDGAFSRHNNPVNIALWETKRIWPNLEPDVVISLGTGMKEKNTISKHLSIWDLLKTRGLPKMWNSFMSFLEGEESWRDLVNCLNRRTRNDYFRFNVAIPGYVPSLDDVSAMDSMSASIRKVTEGGSELRDALSALLVSCFYFELTRAPVRQGRQMHHVIGRIRCRLNFPRPLIKTLHRLHSPLIRFFNGEVNLGADLVEDDICSACLRYSTNVELLVESIDTPIELAMTWKDDDRVISRRLSNMPRSSAWFVKTQRLDSVYGNPNHGASGRLRCPLCDTVPSALARGGRKRRLETQYYARKRPNIGSSV